MKKRSILSKALGAALMIGLLLGNGSQASAAEVSEGSSPVVGNTELTTTIPHTKRSGDSNYFTFAEGRWENGDNEHTWSKSVDAANPSATYYEVEFVGHKIDIYSGKNRPHGKVKYFINDVEKDEFDLYNRDNINSTKIATYTVEGEGPHTFRAVATGTNGAGTDSGFIIDAAQVVVYHDRYAVTSITPTTTSINLKQGQTQQLAYTVTPDYAKEGNITYASENEAVATVNAEGVVTAAGIGSTNIKIKSEADSKEASVAVTVTEAQTEIKASIVDENLQWTQDKYNALKAAEKKSTETLNAWKNDTVLSQISVLTVGSAANNLKAEAADLTGANGQKIDAEHVNLTFLKSVEAYTGMPGYTTIPPRAIPQGNRAEANEVLYQDAGTPMNVGYDKIQNIWVSIDVPADTAPGTYTGTISISADGLATAETVSYTVNVADAVLPDAEAFADGFDIELWQNPYASAYYYDVEPFSEEHFAVLTPIMEKYKSIGGYAITTSIVEEAWQGQTYGPNDIKFPSMVDWTKNADGTWSFDYEDFDKWVKFNRDLGIGEKIVCYSIAPWTFKITYHDAASNTQKNIAISQGGWSSEWENAWRAFLQDLIQHLTAKGWKEDTYIGIDERGFNVKAFDLIDSVLDIKGEPLKTAGAMDAFTSKKDLAMRLDVWSVGSTAVKAHPAEFAQLLEERNELGLKTTVYTCTGHKPGSFSLSAPGESYWTMMYSYSVGTSGYMRWSYDAWVENPLEDTTHCNFEAGDCFLVFPGDSKENPAVRSSTRLEKMAQGVRDVNKLLIMEEEVSAMGAKVDTLMGTIKANYPSGTYYLTDEGKNTLSADMDTVTAQIAQLTTEYIAAKAAGTSEVESVTIDGGESISLAIMGTKQLNATFAPATVLNQRVTWSSSDPGVVSVNQRGVATALKMGTATIRAISEQDSTKMDTITVVVERPEIASDALVSYYSFDTEDGNTIADSWGTRTGTNAGGEYVNGKSGKGLKVDGANNKKATFPAASNLTEQWTVGYWMYITAAPTGRSSVIMSENGHYSLNNRMAGSANPGVNVGAASNQILTMAGTIPVNSWVNMTWTNDKTNGLRLYINGTMTKENAWTKTNNFPAPVEVVGGTGFSGIVDEVKIYNRALTASEVSVSMLTNGLNLPETSITMSPDDTYTLNASLIADADADYTLRYSSSNEEVASVDEDGVITAHKTGKAVITVTNGDGAYSAEVAVSVVKVFGFRPSIPVHELDEQYLSDVEKDYNNEKGRRYLAHPDMIMLDDNQTLITAYAIGHGKGEVVMQISRDGGETWTEKTDKPNSWKNSYETPTLYKLDFQDGSQKLIMISGRPNWYQNPNGGWDTSISEDGGEHWTEYETFHPQMPNGSQNWSVVAMGSLVHLKDAEGNYIDKWMGVYHTNGYYNYKTYLTFDSEGNQQWSVPELYLDEHRAIEDKYGLCEIGMFRSPDGKRIVGLARSDKKSPTTHKSMMFYSDDEGDTWSEPVELPASLYGERHKMVYDPISGRLVITFREIVGDKNGNGVHEGSSDWYAGEWLAWVGTYEDIMEQNEGQYIILLDRDYANNTYSGDTGYAGIVAQPDGTLIMDTYGHWDEAFSKSWTGGVTADLCWIQQAKFKLGSIDYALGLVDRTELQAVYDAYKDAQRGDADEESFAAFTEALNAAKAGLDDTSMQQIQLDALQEELELAYAAIQPEEPEDPVEPDQPVDPKPEKPWIFTDLLENENDWKYLGARYLYNRGIMNGLTNSTLFAPNRNLTRAEFAAIIHRAAGSPQVEYRNRFEDVPNNGAWYVQPILWAESQNMVSGVEDGKRYGRDLFIKRQEIIKILYYYAKDFKKIDVSDLASLDSFTDASAVKSWAQAPMQWAVKAGMISGKPNGDGTYKLDPDANATRAEIAKMVSEFMKKYQPHD